MAIAPSVLVPQPSHPHSSPKKKAARASKRPPSPGEVEAIAAQLAPSDETPHPSDPFPLPPGEPTLPAVRPSREETYESDLDEADTGDLDE